MSKRLLSILLSELRTIRIRCKKCKAEATIECPVESVNRMFDQGGCRFCGEELRCPADDQNTPYLVTFAKALQRLNEDPNFAIEFVVPVSEESP